MNRYTTVNIVERASDPVVEIMSRSDLQRWIQIPNEEWREIVLDWAEHYRTAVDGEAQG